MDQLIENAKDEKSVPNSASRCYNIIIIINYIIHPLPFLPFIFKISKKKEKFFEKIDKKRQKVKKEVRKEVKKKYKK